MATEAGTNTKAAPAMRILYLAGPGDVAGTYRHWVAGHDDPSEVSITYSAQFYEICRREGAAALVISSCPKPDSISDGNIRIVHRSRPLISSHGIGYHLSQIIYALQTMLTALFFRPDVVIITNVTHWFLFAPFAWLGVWVIPSMHSALWPVGFRPAGIVQRIVARLNGWFWRRIADSTICVSSECQRQIEELAGRLKGPIRVVYAQYRQESFETIATPPDSAKGFHILYAGRIEREKGVFDLLDMAEQLERRQPGKLQWEICGEGDCLEELTAAVQRKGMAALFKLRGKLNREEMREVYGWSHVVVVPTKSSFAEGLNKVAVESMLAGRPLVTSRLCNAIELMGEAVCDVPPNDTAAYAEAIWQLVTDPELYERRWRACREVCKPFYDREQSWGRAVERVIRQYDDRNKQGGRPQPTFRSTPRIAVIQHGDYLAALETIHAGSSEPYFGMRNSMAVLASLLDPHPHIVISLDSGVYDREIAGARHIGLPHPPRSRWVPGIVQGYFWGRRVGRQVRMFRPTHVLLRTGNPFIATQVLRFCRRGKISALVLLANMMSPRGRLRMRYWDRELVHLLNDDCVFMVGNHKLPAVQSMLETGVSATKVVAYDWPGYRRPADLPPKELDGTRDPTLVFVGSITFAKGIGDLIGAVRLLSQAGWRGRLVVAGAGDALGHLRSTCLDLADRVVFLGRIGNEEAFKLMRNASLVCVPTRHEFAEGMPLSLTEALASRTPVIASDHPVFRRAFIDGEGLRFFKAADSSSLADAIRCVLSDPAQYAHLSQTTETAFMKVECKTTFGDLIARWQATFEQ